MERTLYLLSKSTDYDLRSLVSYILSARNSFQLPGAQLWNLLMYCAGETETERERERRERFESDYTFGSL